MKDITFEKKSENNFLVYAYSVIKARAISNVEDNLKPVHRRIIYDMGELGLGGNAKFVKCARVVGDVMGKLHPHGDASIYDALIRLSQPWKMRYPLVEVQGNAGNIIGDGPAASRYTECRLSKYGDLMLDGLKDSKIKFIDNYDQSCQEPTLLPSVFPNILCNGNMGIAVGLSASLIPYNLKEVCAAIVARINNEENPLSHIKGPDFPTGGKIVNAENLPEIYQTGRGTIKVQAHYKLEQKDGKVNIIFTDLPYGVEIEGGVIIPLKKYILEEGCDFFENYLDETSDYNKVAIRVVLAKGADVNKALAILFDKTSLESTIAVNNTVLIGSDPRTLGMLALIDNYISYRSEVLKGIAATQQEKIQHKLTVAIGLQTCTSDIDKLIKLIRAADDRSAAKKSIMTAFELNEEQANAVLDMKVSRLSHLDVKDIEDSLKELNYQLCLQKQIVEEENARKSIIKEQLGDLAAKYGDERRTEVTLSQEAPASVAAIVSHQMLCYIDGIQETINPNAFAAVVGKRSGDFFGYDAEGNYSDKNCVGFSENVAKKKFVTVSKNGMIKVSLADEYATKRGKLCKLKTGDSLIYASFVNDDDYILALGQDNTLSKLKISELTVTGKASQGSVIGIGALRTAFAATDQDLVFMADKDNKAKLTAVSDLSVNSRTSKGQSIMENIAWLLPATGRETFYAITNTDKIVELSASKLSVKGKTAGGVSTTSRALKRIIQNIPKKLRCAILNWIMSKFTTNI